MSGNAAPDPTILKRKTREAQEHAITSCHPQLDQEYNDNDPCYYTPLRLLYFSAEASVPPAPSPCGILRATHLPPTRMMKTRMSRLPTAVIFAPAT